MIQKSNFEHLIKLLVFSSYLLDKNVYKKVPVQEGMSLNIFNEENKWKVKKNVIFNEWDSSQQPNDVMNITWVDRMTLLAT